MTEHTMSKNENIRLQLIQSLINRPRLPSETYRNADALVKEAITLAAFVIDPVPQLMSVGDQEAQTMMSPSPPPVDDEIPF